MCAPKNIMLLLLVALTVFACKEELIGPPGGDGKGPGPVSNVSVENLPGAAKLTYTLPSDPDLMYVVAEFSPRTNSNRDVKSSFYNNSLVVDGFGESKPFEVRLYAVDKEEKRSEPVIVTVNPATPPIQKVYASVELKEDFGGLNVRFKNPDGGNIVFSVMKKNSGSEFQEIQKYYTKDTAGTFSVRGMPSEPVTFGVVLRDRWDNHSDTLTADLTPIYEVQVPDNTITLKKMTGDVFTPRSPWKWEWIWDGIIEHTANKFLVTQVGTGMPQSFTMDLGKTYKLSRYKYWQRTDASYYAQGPQYWELYGSNDPNPDGSFDASWVKLLSCEHVKPSGLPPGENTAEDLEKLKAGLEFNFPLDAPPCRYIRWKTLSSWAGTDFQVLGDIIVYGNDQ
ncbi:DUF5000 domain-containing lipoprotein [Pseudobacter ginsenosidimutans]|uniref:Uncharacterized protein DUF5126 n=1 Tax=Pseudobacter ginsenosidimutans TaxID=661488 RepID=A0A4Q7MAQ8_9BACT|nr:DUF5000 domain-containing lipoprotein [Pseudobacter ginsenosidimutans]QEC42610.1 DUF4959 domain-containing protein [Pseudobacter ginsenosidimutans]RZS63898.1 uncharacterized protein DUF5126 [Pseudobacter ginsenosidimutans]